MRGTFSQFFVVSFMVMVLVTIGLLASIPIVPNKALVGTKNPS